MLHAAPPPGKDKYPFEPHSPSSLTYITRVINLAKEDRGRPVCAGGTCVCGFRLWWFLQTLPSQRWSPQKHHAGAAVSFREQQRVCSTLGVCRCFCLS